MGAFVCYCIKERDKGRSLRSFEDVVDLEQWKGPRPSVYTTPDNSAVDARLYLVAAHPDEPEWAPFLRTGFGANLQLKKSSAPGALLIVRFEWRKQTRMVAFSFGVGRYLLLSTVFERRFGMRVALNLIFEMGIGPDDGDTSRLRSVDAKRVNANPVRMRHQSSQRAALEAFEFERDRDLLRGVTGIPANTDWGTNVTGTDSLTTNASLKFSDLPGFCQRLLDAHSDQSYRRQYSWIDDVGIVTDEQILRGLEETVIADLRAGDADHLEFGIPQLVEWDRIVSFSYPYERRAKLTHPDLRLADYLRILRRNAAIDSLDVDLLRRQKINLLDADNKLSYQWSVWRCLYGELKVGGRTYILDDGDFYEVASGFMGELDRFLSSIPATDIGLPDADVRATEATYNKNAAAPAGLLMLDKKLVKITRSTTPIELCDLLSERRQFVHVKRKLGSASLSHMFSQGMVSAELLQANTEFQEQARTIAIGAASEFGAPAWATLSGAFDYMSTGLKTSDVEVVYAIIADWQGRSLVERMPFFSKINMRRCALDLQQRGFKVSWCAVQTTRQRIQEA